MLHQLTATASVKSRLKNFLKELIKKQFDRFHTGSKSLMTSLFI
jgi:hypothetical protein